MGWSDGGDRGGVKGDHQIKPKYSPSVDYKTVDL